VLSVFHALLSAIARWNRPLAFGETIRAETIPAAGIARRG